MDPVKHVRQPTDVTCAQACAAMLLGAPIETVIRELPPTSDGTRHREFIEFLRRCGVDVGERFTSARARAWPKNAIARITWPDGDGHLVIKLGRVWHDPLFRRPFRHQHDRELRLHRTWARGGRVTSFLEVRALPIAA